MSKGRRENILVALIGLAMSVSLAYASQHVEHGYKTYLDKVYEGISGFNIAMQDRTLIEQHGGNPTYGEITYDAVKTLIDDLQLDSNDVFYDLGCGVGKMVMQIYLESPVKKSIGIELSQTRIDNAQKARQRLVGDGKLQHGRALNFRHGDILKSNISDATVLFMCATCFSEDFMRKATEKFAKLRPGLLVVTLKHLAPHPRFKLIKTHTLPMTWSSSSFVYVYELLEQTSSNSKQQPVV